MPPYMPQPPTRPRLHPELTGESQDDSLWRGAGVVEVGRHRGLKIPRSEGPYRFKSGLRQEGRDRIRARARQMNVAGSSAA